MVLPYRNDTVYIVFYVNVDTPEISEVLAVFNNKTDAVNGLLEKANFREINGQLTYYMEPTNMYESFSALKALVEQEMELNDVDIYRITQLRIS
jgi:hypothetical protein